MIFLPINGALTQQDKENIKRVIRLTMDCNKIPGLSISIVDNNQLAMSEGFGKLDFDNPDKNVDAASAFSIGSLTKAFTSTLMAIVLEKSGKYNLDTTIKEIIPDLELNNPLLTDHATIRDLLSHKLGALPYGITWLIGLGTQHPRKDYCGSRLKYVKSQSFRKKFAYSNFMILLAGCVIEKITGKSYEEVFDEEISKKLGFENTDILSNVDNWDWNKVASPHAFYKRQQKITRLDRENLKTVAPTEPSGGVFSSANDMAKWILLHVNNGVFNNKTIVSTEYMEEIHGIQFAQYFDSSTQTKPYFPVENNNRITYGLGWDIGTYNGYKVISHGGTIAGYQSKLTMLKDVKSGIYISCNTFNDNSTLPAITAYVSDLLTGNSPFLNETTICSFPKPWSDNLPKQENNLKKYAPFKKMKKMDQFNENAKMENDKCIGIYGHPLFGNITVWYVESEQKLHIKTGQVGSGRLRPVLGPGIFFAEPYGPISYVTEIGDPVAFPIQFNDELNGKYQTVRNLALEPGDDIVHRRGVQWN